MPAQLDRAYQKKEPIAVVLWSPHWAYEKYDLTRLADPEKTWGASNQIRTLAHRDFPEKYSELNGWLKNRHMTPEELMSLEQAVRKAGRGQEDAGVEVVTVSALMPAHGHGTKPPVIERVGDEVRVKELVLYMSGRWEVRLVLRASGHEDEALLTVDVP